MLRPETRSAAKMAAGLLGRGALVLGAVLGGVRVLLPRPAAAVPGEEDDTSEQVGRGRPGKHASLRSRKAGHEMGDMSGPLMARVVAGLGMTAATVVLGMIGLRLLFTNTLTASRPTLTSQQTERVAPPLPHLQADPVGDLARLHAKEDDLLGDYAWIDPAHTRARVPVERAMTLILGQKLDPAP